MNNEDLRVEWKGFWWAENLKDEYTFPHKEKHSSSITVQLVEFTPEINSSW